MVPTLGRTVLYTFPVGIPLGHELEAGQSQTVPAVVVAVWSPTCVNLRVFQDGSAVPLWVTSVSHREAADLDAGFWVWPPRV